MRKDLQEINNNMDKNIENKKNKNIIEDRKGNKPSLKPIIFKKESCKNPTINKNQNFGRHGNKIAGNNKNINEDNKNIMAQRYNALLYKQKNKFQILLFLLFINKLFYFIILSNLKLIIVWGLGPISIILSNIINIII